jgi:hypothetical protein
MHLLDSPIEPLSDYFTIENTGNAGRGVFATRNLPTGITVLQSERIAISVISREYRREVCAKCFNYERGYNLKIRNTSVNFSFCSKECEQAWNQLNQGIPAEAWRVTEDFIKSKAIKSALSDQAFADETLVRPTKAEIDEAWLSVESTAHFIHQARCGSKAKHSQRSLQATRDIVAVSDVLYWFVSGILTHYAYDISQSNDWEAFLALAPDEEPYHSSAHLKQHVYGYLQLLCILPVPLLPSVTPEVCRAIVTRDVHNSFGIRSLDDEGSEIFGWGVWPDASYFNHSCTPNLAKSREGRAWSFWANTAIQPKDQLFISYLGGDEKDLNLKERQQRLSKAWGFDCLCFRCIKESASEVDHKALCSKLDSHSTDGS